MLKYWIFFLTLLPLFGSAQTNLTFNQDIAPIIFNNCTSCHRAGEIGPFTLTSYDEVTSFAVGIRNEVESKGMPPWQPDPNYSHFLDERILADADRNKIIEWIDNGMPEGTGQAPELPKFPTTSQIGSPTFTLSPTEPFTINSDLDVYRCYAYTLDDFINADVSAFAVEPRPGNAAIVHHMTVYMDTTGWTLGQMGGQKKAQFQCNDDPAAHGAFMIAGWAPGSIPRQLPKDFGFKLYKKGVIVLQVHYAPGSKNLVDESKINFFIAPQEPPRLVRMRYMINLGIFLPANQITSFTAQNFIDTTISLVGVYPHMHLLGTKIKVYALTEAGDTIKLCNIPKWDFHWQNLYTFPKMVKIPKNSFLMAEGTWDNTSANPHNVHNPPIDIAWGEKTTDEMLATAFQEVYYQDGDENVSLKEVTAVDPLAENANVSLDIYPNPSRGPLVIDYAFDPNAKQLELKLVNLLGETVYQQSLNRTQGLLEMSFPQLPSGVYFCQLQQNGQTVKTHKLILSR